jgi:hypothetical protein
VSNVPLENGQILAVVHRGFDTLGCGSGALALAVRSPL